PVSRNETMNRSSADSSPSPGGEGWGEGERSLKGKFLPTHPKQVHGEGEQDPRPHTDTLVLNDAPSVSPSSADRPISEVLITFALRISEKLSLDESLAL